MPPQPSDPIGKPLIAIRPASPRELAIMGWSFDCHAVALELQGGGVILAAQDFFCNAPGQFMWIPADASDATILRVPEAVEATGANYPIPTIDVELMP